MAVMLVQLFVHHGNPSIFMCGAPAVLAFLARVVAPIASYNIMSVPFSYRTVLDANVQLRISISFIC